MRPQPYVCFAVFLANLVGRFGGVLMDPRYSRQDTRDIIAAIRKVYPVVMA